AEKNPHRKKRRPGTWTFFGIQRHLSDQRSHAETPSVLFLPRHTRRAIHRQWILRRRQSATGSPAHQPTQGAALRIHFNKKRPDVRQQTERGGPRGCKAWSARAGGASQKDRHRQCFIVRPTRVETGLK